MPSFIVTARTNYFRVKDLWAFKADLRRYGITPGGWNEHNDLIIDDDVCNSPRGSIALFCYNSWPMLDEDSTAMRLDIEDPDTPVPSDYDGLEDLIAAHLVDTDVAVLMSVGVERVRYLTGSAVAVNSRGEKRTVLLDDIYDLAEKHLTLSPDTIVTRAIN